MDAEQVRLAELVGGLSVVNDLSRGLDAGSGLRACVMAMRLAELADASDEDREAVYWVALLRFVGCTATASDMASALGDELAVSAAFAAADTHDLRQVLRGAVAAVGSRPDRLVAFLLRAPAVVRDHEVVSCEVARSLAEELGLPPGIGAALLQVFERWDGKGNPGKAAGAELLLPVRLWQVAHLADRIGLDADEEAPLEPTWLPRLRDRAGKQLDPDLVDMFIAEAGDLTDTGRRADLDAVLAAEPVPHRTVAGARLDAVFELFGLVGDLKSPFFRGHSGRVATLAEAAARGLGLPEPEVHLIRRAALVQDVGRVAVSSRVWNATSPLDDADREQVRLHPYFTHRALARVPALAEVAELAAGHHERSDGSGYHRGLRGDGLPVGAAVLAATDRYVTAGEDRPHRPALAAEAQVDLLLDDARAGRFPPKVVDALLAAAEPGAVPPAAPKPTDESPLTPREREVLSAVAIGLTNAAAARRLGISAKTVNTHLEHAYAKLGVSTRTAAVVIATRRDWLDLDGPPSG